ncbi:hypothetical protein WAI453_011374 [Rhynchosporium graminicola]|uniref:Protein kinase domain-containing protein n=1 Tax=Rhynchosporium graminicola TaxID=2792576 RepID=A0A1E1KBR3_9HELO|nr:uncharacterized protein RCO7_05719 [Rhynchosporium commune]
MAILQVAQTITGSKGSYELTRAIVNGVHRSRVFKAKILYGTDSVLHGSHVLIKTTTPERRKFLSQEHDVYCKPAISSSPFVRKLYDKISDPPCLVLEWMDQTLAEVPPETQFRNDALYKAIFEAGLHAVTALYDENLVHADLKPDNILISDITSPEPTVKIGDLGAAVEHGFNEYQVQPYAMRAPEVWQEYRCTHRSEVWSLAATVLAWAKPGILGTPGIKDGVWPDLSCIAKLMRAFPKWAALPATSRMNELTWDCAKALSNARDPERPSQYYIEAPSLEKELQSFLDETVEIFRFLLVTDPEMRPSAASALLSSEFRALINKAMVTENIK